MIAVADDKASDDKASDDAIMVLCEACEVKNPTCGSDLATTRSCPRCKAAIVPLPAPLDVDAHDLVAVVTSARVPVLIDFWARWCPPCRLVGPIVKKVGADMAGKALVLKVDTDLQPELAAEFEVSAIPTFVLIGDRRIASRHAGLARPGTMKRWLSTDLTVEEK